MHTAQSIQASLTAHSKVDETFHVVKTFSCPVQLFYLNAYSLRFKAEAAMIS